MSPDRTRTPCSSKPYSRQTTPDTPPTDDQPKTSLNKIGFPTHAQYKQVEAAYLASLNPSRRDKALISQELFDRIWAVLHNPDLDSESSQFRFWVRKNFTFGTLNKKPEGGSTVPKPDEAPVDEEEEEVGQTVVLHQKSLVAVQEQIYDILCYGHGISGHAGRDKTCASVRQHYTWIPKGLVARFIKACPTCIAKKCGIPNEGDQGTKDLLPNIRQYLRNISADSDEKENVCEDIDIDTTVSRRPEPDSMADFGNRLDRVANNHSAPAHCGTLQSLPMTREVSLYKGLPNGWQFRHDNFDSAQEEFLLKKGTMIPTGDPPTAGVRTARPRVPSIAPMTRAFTVPLAADKGTHTPLQTGNCNTELGFSPSSPLPMIPRQDSLASQINPILLSDDSAPVSCATTPLIPAVPILRPVLPPSIAGAAAPPALNLEALGSHKTIQSFLVLRDTHSPTQSPGSFALRGSPTSSECSELSSFPMSAQSSVSPTSTALATPVDVVGSTMGLGLGLGESVAKDLAEKAGSMVLSIGAEAVASAVMVQ